MELLLEILGIFLGCLTFFFKSLFLIFTMLIPWAKAWINYLINPAETSYTFSEDDFYNYYADGSDGP